MVQNIGCAQLRHNANGYGKYNNDKTTIIVLSSLPFPTFPLSVPPLVVSWQYLEQDYNSATGHSVWLVQSPGTVYHLTFVRHLHYQRSKWCSRHIYFLDPTSVTNCLPEYEQRTLCGALVVTLAMLLRLINCRFIIIIIIIYDKAIAKAHSGHLNECGPVPGANL